MSAKVVFTTEDDAKKLADAKNAEPLPEGKEKRTPFKVYRVSQNGNVRYAVSQTPMNALHNAHTEFGIVVENIGGGETLLPVNDYLARLSPEQLAEARKYLGAA